MQEVDFITIKKSKIVVDSIEECLIEGFFLILFFKAGDLIKAIDENIIQKDDIKFSIGDIIVNNINVRENYDDITLFKSVGNALQDVFFFFLK
jgi:ornithine cyclodeaminase/alanine dehydrogenase-like protein (mu-crystallin family)